jgi:hypothetical protein
MRRLALAYGRLVFTPSLPDRLVRRPVTTTAARTAATTSVTAALDRLSATDEALLEVVEVLEVVEALVALDVVEVLLTSDTFASDCAFSAPQ